MQQQLECALKVIRELVPELPREEVPRLIGQLAEINASALLRLVAPPPAQPQHDDNDCAPAPEAAAMLGIKLSTFYGVWKERYAHLRRNDVGGKLIFSKFAIREHIRQHLG